MNKDYKELQRLIEEMAIATKYHDGVLMFLLRIRMDELKSKLRGVNYELQF